MHEMSPSQLAARCQNAQPDASHEPSCFELFRRAIVENCSLSWHYLHNQYYSLVYYWVSRRAPTDPDTVNDLTQDALTSFWRFYTSDKLARAGGLGDILAYLKSCVMSAISQTHRKEKRRVPEVALAHHIVDVQSVTQSAEVLASQQITAQQIWTIVESHCNDDLEHLVARSIFLADLKPRHIAEQFPDLFPDVLEVYRIKRNLIGRLRRDPVLQEICKK